MPGESAQQNANQEEYQRPREREAHGIETGKVILEREYVQAHCHEQHGQAQRRDERQNCKNLSAPLTHLTIHLLWQSRDDASCAERPG